MTDAVPPEAAGAQPPGLLVVPYLRPGPGTTLIGPQVRVPDTADELAGVVRGLLRFPTADLVGAAASMWPVLERTSRTRRWGRYNDDERDAIEYRDDAEGGWPRFDIAPGLVRFRREDSARGERTRERIRRARERDVDERVQRARNAYALERHERFLEEYEGPMTREAASGLHEREVDQRDEYQGRRGVTSWSAKSRARMIAGISSLDTAPVLDEGIPGMLTLTAPGDWLAVMPSAEVAAACFHRFTRAYAKTWGPLRCIWKREFQRRGAPHWHLWMVPPTHTVKCRDAGRRDCTCNFRRWLRYAWATAMQVERISDSERDRRNASQEWKLLSADHMSLAADRDDRTPCRCSEWCRSINAGTGVDFAEGMRATDPRRLAVYFLKESLGGEGKAYQNDAPIEWAEPDPRTGELVWSSVGRFWGVRGIEKAVATVDVAPQDQYRVWRVLRRLRLSSAGTRQRTVVRGVKADGSPRYRRVHRPVTMGATAGWVAVNDGAAIGDQLGRFAASFVRYRSGGQEPPVGMRGPIAERVKPVDVGVSLMPDAESSWWSAF